MTHMVDEALRAAARDPHAAPLERMRQALIAAHSHDGGLVFCENENDEEVNAAARDGRRITIQLYSGDVILAVPVNLSKYVLAEPWIGAVVATKWEEQWRHWQPWGFDHQVRDDRTRERLKIEPEIEVRDDRTRERLKIEPEIAVVAVFDILGQKPGPEVTGRPPGVFVGLKWVEQFGKYKISVLMRGGSIA